MAQRDHSLLQVVAGACSPLVERNIVSDLSECKGGLVEGKVYLKY